MGRTAMGNGILKFSGSDLLRDLDLTDEELNHLWISRWSPTNNSFAQSIQRR